MLISVEPEVSYPSIDSPFLQKPISLVDTTFSLFGFLPDDKDPRWAFLSRYDEIKRTVGFRALNFANAWNATYLSDEASYRAGFVTSANSLNSLQLDRALTNVEHVHDVSNRYATSADDYSDFDIRLSQTDRISTNPDEPKHPETPCPEALYQIRLYDEGYLARVGFNLHEEDGSTILSIVNIQGTPDGIKRNAKFEAEFGVSPFNLLVKRALSLAEAQSPRYNVRGMINPDRGNPQLYWGVLSQEGVELYHAQRKSIDHNP
jgi:hypothetical protein